MRAKAFIVSVLLSCLSATAVVVTDYDPSLLSSNLFTDITRDRSGYLWVATEYGLNKFDGVRFTAYYGDYGREGDLHTSRVVRLFADTCAGAPDLWVLFYGALQYYDAMTDRFEYVDLSDMEEVALTAIFRKDGELFIHSKGSGLWRLEKTDDGYRALMRDTNTTTEQTTAVEGRYSTDQQWFDEEEQSVCFRDTDGTIWQGVIQKELTRISPQEPGATYVPLNGKWSNGQPIYSCLVAPSGNVYINQTENGLRCVNRNGEQTGATLLPGLTGASALELRDGRTLIGTTTEGIYVFDVQRDDVRSTKEIAHLYLSTNKVKSMVEAEPGIVYAGMMEGGVQRIDMQTMEVSTPEGYYPTNIYVNKLALDSAGILWIGHYSGIDLYDTRNHCMVEPNWRENSAKVAEQLLTTAVYDILFDSGKTYIASNKGLFVYDQSLISNHQSIRSRYTMEDGLPSNVICRMLRDEDGNIWMSTFHGITMFDPAQEPVFINYYLGGGMQAYRYVRGAGDNLPTGELLFPDDNGVTIISPKLLAGKPFTRQIALSSLYVSGKRVTPAQEIRVSYLDNLITMQFSPLDMRDNRNVSYLYRFAEDDSSVWHSTLPGESTITLSHLGYGRHVLMVRARDGMAYSEPAKWIIYIIPPLYLRWWAIVLYIILFLGVINYIVYAYHRAKERQLLREQLQFYINRSHELPLTLTVELKGNDKVLMEKMMTYITAHLDDSDLSVEKIADAVGVSRAQLQRRVKDITGTGVGSFVRELRLKQAAQLLLSGDVNVSQVGYSVGFNAPNVFSTAFKKYFGVSPKEYQNNVQRDNVQGTKEEEQEMNNS